MGFLKGDESKGKNRRERSNKDPKSARAEEDFQRRRKSERTLGVPSLRPVDQVGVQVVGLKLRESLVESSSNVSLSVEPEGRAVEAER